MLGLVVLATDLGDGVAPGSLLEDLLGVPVLARAIAASLPTDEAVAGVLVAPEDQAERFKAEAIDRFGFDEIDRVVHAGPGVAAGLKAGLDALGEDITEVIVMAGGQPLAPIGLVDKVVAALREKGEGAAPAVAVPGHIVADEGDGVVPLDVRPRLRRLQSPQAFKRDALQSAADTAVDDHVVDAAGQVLAAGGAVGIVDGDDDNLLLAGGADLGRAVEVFSRRAVDYAFVYPKDLLPDDPLAAALAPGEDLGEGLGTSRDDDGSSDQQGA